jgi:hypothetical protein
VSGCERFALYYRYRYVAPGTSPPVGGRKSFQAFAFCSDFFYGRVFPMKFETRTRNCMGLILVTILLFTAGLTWWLSGYDSKVKGHDRATDIGRRFVRSFITLIIVGIGANQFLNGGTIGGFACVVLLMPLAPFWMGCVAELFSGGVMHLVDRPDDREFNPTQITRDLDRLAELVRSGQNTEAIELCRTLLESPEVSAMAIETKLFEIYAEMFSNDRLARSTALGEVQQLAGAGRFAEAVEKLEALLKKEPGNAGAAFLLMRIHAEQMHQPDQARLVLHLFAQQKSMPPAFDAYARRCLKEWSGAVPPRQKTEEGVESLLVRNRPATPPKPGIDTHSASPDELLAAGHLSSAIEILENRTREQPQEFDAWLKLAEAHGAYCRDFLRAGKIVDKIASNPAFSPEQIRLAKEKLREWRTSKRPLTAGSL